MKRQTRNLTVLVGGLLASSLAHADGEAVRRPADPAGSQQTVSVTNGSVIDLNPGRDSVSTDAGYDSVTSVRVDSTNGDLGGFISYELPTATTFQEAQASTALGFLSIAGVFDGPADPEMVDVTLEIDFNGSFFTDSGSPILLAFTDLVASTFSTTPPFDGFSYISQLGFLSTPLNPPGMIETSFLASLSPLSGGPSVDYDDAAAEFFSAVPENLNARLRLTIPVSSGDNLLLFGGVTGSVTSGPDPADTDSSDGTDVLPAAAEIDWSNTAQIRVFVPEGYRILGDDPLLDTIVFTVPENQDTDMDGIDDTADNCLLAANPDQRDTDADGIGNVCDGDFNNDCQQNFSDLGQMKNVFFMQGDRVEDMNGDLTVNFADLGLLKQMFFQPPGPAAPPTVCDP